MNDLFDDLVMDKEKKDQMRDTLRQTKAAKNTPLIVMGAVAAAIALVMVIPFTRTAIVSAAEKLIEQFTTHNGTHVEISVEPDQTHVSIDYDKIGPINEIRMVNGEDQSYIGIRSSENPSSDYAQLIDGRIYFVLDGKKTDVTDKVSDKDFFRHEIRNKDGSREVIFIGGTPDKFGWWSLYFNANGNYIFNQGTIPVGPDEKNPEWYRNACHSEHVYCGEDDCEYAPDA